MLVGRLRRWNASDLWGFVFSELHNCDIVTDGSDGGESLEEGVHVLFRLHYDESDMPVARGVRKATAREIEDQRSLLLPAYSRHGRAQHSPGARAETHISSAGPSDAVSRQTLHVAPCVPPVVPITQRTPPPPPPMPPSGQAFVHSTQDSYAQYGYCGDRAPSAYAWQGSGGSCGSASAVSYTGVGISSLDHRLLSQGVPLLLAPPALLEDFDARNLAQVLGQSERHQRRARTFNSSRNGSFMELGREFGELLKQQEVDETERRPGDQWSWWSQGGACLDPQMSTMPCVTATVLATHGDAGLYAMGDRKSVV